MARRDPRVITVRRSTIVRAGIVALVLAALGVGIAIGLTANSSPSTTQSTAKGPSTTTGHGASTTATTSPTSTTAGGVPAVLSCGPSPTPHVRPTRITVGCATGAITLTGITWKTWGENTGGQGSGTLNVNNCQPNCASGTTRSAPAIVIVFQPVSGIYQDVSITPTQGLSSTPKPPSTSSTTVPLTTTTSSGPAPVAASQPGTGWGGD